MTNVRVRYRLTTQLTEEHYAAACAELSAEERARHDRLLFERDRRDFAFAHALLYTMLAEAGLRRDAGWSFAYGEHGKPHIAGGDRGESNVVFNLSHTRGLVACATTRDGQSGVEVGVDVEPVRARDSGRDIAARFFCAEEVAVLDACAEESARARLFTELWTLKESYIKGIGLGLACPLHSFAFRYGGAGELAFESPPGSSRPDWQFGLFAPTDEFRLAVAVKAGIDVPRVVVSDADAPEPELPATRSTFRDIRLADRREIPDRS